MASFKDIQEFRKRTVKTFDENGCTIKCSKGKFTVSYKNETACVKEAFLRFEHARNIGVYNDA